MRSRHTSKKSKVSYIILSVIVVIVFVVTCMAHELNEHLAEMTEYRGREAAEEVITSALGFPVCRIPEKIGTYPVPSE